MLAFYPSLTSPGSNIRGSQSSGVAISKWGTPRILRSEPSNSLWVRRGMLRPSTSVSYQIISAAPTLSFQSLSFNAMFLLFKVDCRTHQVPKVSQKVLQKVSHKKVFQKMSLKVSQSVKKCLVKKCKKMVSIKV